MSNGSPLPPGFYDRDVLAVARDLLGQRLVRPLDGRRVSGIITEVEAYRGEEDLACHARAGRTPRTEVMYGEPGLAYVYFTYGMHWLLNAVCGPAGFPAAVLIRAIRPLEGVDVIAANRPNVKPAQWTNGPGKICRALQIDGADNGRALTAVESGLWVEPGEPVLDEQVRTGPRVGIDSVPEPWLSMPWRFQITGR